MVRRVRTLLLLRSGAQEIGIRMRVRTKARYEAAVAFAPPCTQDTPPMHSGRIRTLRSSPPGARAREQVLIVDDHPLVLDALRVTVQWTFPGALVSLAVDLSKAIEAALQAERLDLVALDLQLPDSSGIATLTRFLQHCSQAPVIVVSGQEEPGVIRDALTAGARGYVPKSSSRDVLMAALRLVAGGGIYIPPQVLSVMNEQPGLAGSDGSPASSPLTERQIEVLSLASQGLGNRLIARQLGIAEDTVKQHLQAVYTALGASSRMQAVVAARRFGIRL
jgi:two-component system, NarL family, nitrate/nitrite response regulator NarL